MFVFLLWFVSFLLLFEKRFYLNIVGLVFVTLFGQYLFINSTILDIPEFLLFSLAVTGVGVGMIFDKWFGGKP